VTEGDHKKKKKKNIKGNIVLDSFRGSNYILVNGGGGRLMGGGPIEQLIILGEGYVILSVRN